MPNDGISISSKFTNALHNQTHPNHHHHQLQSNTTNENQSDSGYVLNEPEQRSNKNGKFKKIVHKVIEWIRKSLLLGRNEVFYLISKLYLYILVFVVIGFLNVLAVNSRVWKHIANPWPSSRLFRLITAFA